MDSCFGPPSGASLLVQNTVTNFKTVTAVATVATVGTVTTVA